MVPAVSTDSRKARTGVASLCARVCGRCAAVGLILAALLQLRRHPRTHLAPRRSGHRARAHGRSRRRGLRPVGAHQDQVRRLLASPLPLPTSASPRPDPRPARIARPAGCFTRPQDSADRLHTRVQVRPVRRAQTPPLADLLGVPLDNGAPALAGLFLRPLVCYN